MEEMEEGRFDREMSIDEEIEFEARAEAFVNMFEGLEKEKFFMANPMRMKQYEFSYAMLLKSIKDIGKDVKITYDRSEHNRTVAWIRLEGKNITTTDIERFSRACEFANATDIYPLTNGNVRIEFTFRNIFNAQ